ncbi:MAG TPA: ABC transporter permease [Blastocatellia bacterium]|nr:ABC transporter permease [Blastocatellia bacterium]
MTRWRQEIRQRLAGLNLEPTREAEIVEELAQHLDDRYRELLSGGATNEQAHRSLQAELRDDELLARELSRVESRIDYEPVISGARRKHVLRDLWQDLPYALRMLRKNPGFTVVAVLSLALGIGANTAIFSLINTVLLRPLPVARPEQLVSLNNTAENHAFPAFSYPNYKDLRDRNEVFSDLIAYRFSPLSLSHDGINERVWGYEVTGNYFEALGVNAALGRLISPDDDRAPGAHPLAVVSYKCWQQRFGGERTIVGRDVIVNGRSYTVIGVAPEGFFGTEVIAAPELWFPVAMQAQLENGINWLDARQVDNLFVQGRLKPGVSTAQAQASLSEIARQLEREYPNDNEGKGIALSAPGLMGNSMRGPVLGFSGLLMIVVGLVLFLACVNLANLLLARAAERRREIAVRLALGASRFRLVRQLLTESVLLALAGGALGLLLAFRFVELVAAFKMPIDIPVAMNLQMDYRVFVFASLISLVTGVLFGLLPAWQATKTDLVPALKDEVSFGGYRRSWLKNSLIVLQVGLSLVLLIGGGLMLRALNQAQTIKLGFNPERAVEVSFDLRLQGYDEARGRELQRRLLGRVQALPGVQFAGLADMAPVDLHFSRNSVFTEGQSPQRVAPTTMSNRATPGYFQAMDTRLTRGRDFTEQDDDKASPVVIINETFARRFWPDEDPIGKRVSLGGPESPKRQVVGVVEDGKYAGLNEDPRPLVSRPLWQSYSGSTIVIVRTTGDPQRLIASIRSEVQQLDPNIPLASRTLAERMDLPLLPARIAASVLGGFGLLALALVAIGIYGVMSYAVAKRTREIGIRMALGAQHSDVLKLIIRQGLTLTLIGMAIGSAAALALTQSMKALLFGISATDPLTFIGVGVLLAGVALLACYLPARRAAKVDPMVALRCE